MQTRKLPGAFAPILWNAAGESERRDAEIREIEAENLREAREELFRKSGVVEKFMSADLADLQNGAAEMRDGSGNAFGINDAEAFVADVASGSPRALLLFGRCGTGKTTLAMAVMHELCRKGVACAYYKSHEIARRIDDARWYSGRESRTEIVSEVCAPRLRVIDEIGRYPDAKNEQFVLFDITNRCYESYRSSIYISNLGKKEFGEFMGGAVVDRLRGIGTTVEFCGRSLRGTAGELYTKWNPGRTRGGRKCQE